MSKLLLATLFGLVLANDCTPDPGTGVGGAGGAGGTSGAGSSECRSGEAGIFRGDVTFDGRGTNPLLGVREVFGDVDLVAPGALPLPCLERVHGNLSVTAREYIAPDDTPFAGLEGLRAVDGELFVGNEDGVGAYNVEGLSGLQTVGSLKVLCLRCENLRGLENLRSVSGDAHLQVPALGSLTALANLTSIGGTLRLWGGEGSALRDLTGLERLGTLGGLEVSSFPITSLRGLASLTRISGDVRLSYTRSLGSLDGLSALRELGGTLALEYFFQPIDLSALGNLERAGGIVLEQVNTPSLEAFSRLVALDVLRVRVLELDDLHGFEGITALRTLEIATRITTLSGLQNLAAVDRVSITYADVTALSELQRLTRLGELELSNLPRLRSLQGLDRVRSISGRVTIHDNAVLESLEGLNQLESVGGDFSLDGCPMLSSLHGLQSLTRVEGALSLYRLASLRDLGGLERLSTARGLSLVGNPNLMNVDGISALTAVSDRLVVYRNGRLPLCEATALASQVRKSCSCPTGTEPVCIPGCTVLGTHVSCTDCTSLQYCSCSGACNCTGNDNFWPFCAP